MFGNKKTIEELEKTIKDMAVALEALDKRVTELEGIRLSAKPVAEPRKELDLTLGFTTDFKPKHTLHPNEDYKG